MARLSTLLLVAACLATTTFCLAADEVEYEFTDSKGEVAGQPKITKGKRPAEDDGERAAADSDRNATGDARPRKRLEAEEVMVNVRRISVYPAVFLIGKFLETSTTEHFRKLAAAELQAAGTSGMTPDGTEIEDSMQRQTMWLSDEQMAADDLVVATAKRVKDMLRRVVSDQNDVPDERKWLKVYATNVSYGGNFQVSKYGAGSYYKAHTDFRAPQMSSAEAFGDRVTTFGARAAVPAAAAALSCVLPAAGSLKRFRPAADPAVMTCAQSRSWRTCRRAGTSPSRSSSGTSRSAPGSGSARCRTCRASTARSATAPAR